MDFALSDIIISELYETEGSAAQSYRARDVSRKLPGVMVLWLKWCLLEVFGEAWLFSSFSGIWDSGCPKRRNCSMMDALLGFVEWERVN